jgi:hypothetical protein
MVTMLLRSLVFSVILITVGFQTASAIVMAEADGRWIKFYTKNTDGSLVWANRDVSTALNLKPIERNPGYNFRSYRRC